MHVKTDDRKRAEVNTVFPGVFAPTIQCQWEGTMYMAQIFFYLAKQGVLNNWFNRADTVELNSIKEKLRLLKSFSNLPRSLL